MLLGLFYLDMTELKLNRQHAAAYGIEFCYQKQNGAWLLYNDTTAPRLLIATISGNDLDGWQWRSEVDGFTPEWDAPSHYASWRAALRGAAFAYLRK